MTRLLCACFALAACGGNSNDDDRVPIGETLERSGILLNLVTGTTNPGINFVNPRTGLASELQYPVLLADRNERVIDIAPDGLSIAYFNPARVLIHAGIAVVDGRPELTQIGAYMGDFGGWRVQFGALGDRIYTDNAMVNTTSGEVFFCGDAEEATSAAQELIPSPDGRHYVCGDVFYDDGVEVGPVTEERNTFDAAGREARFDYSAGFFDHPGVDGGRWLFPQGPYRDFIACSFASGVRTCRIGTNDDPPSESTVVGPDGSTTEDAWPLATLMPPEMQEERGCRYIPYEYFPDRETIIYQVTCHDIDSSTGMTLELVRQVRLLGVGRAGELRALNFLVDGQPPAPQFPTEKEFPWQWKGAFKHSALPRFGGSFLVYAITPNGARADHFYGNIGGASLEIRGHLIANDGTAIWSESEFFTDSGPPTYCVREVRADGEPECMKQPTGGKPIAIVGQGLGDDMASTAVRQLSRSAGAAGDTLVVWGVGFGAEGSVTIGDYEVPPSNRTWSDTRIDLTVSEQWPEAGKVIVTTPNGSNENHQERWFYRVP